MIKKTFLVVVMALSAFWAENAKAAAIDASMAKQLGVAFLAKSTLPSKKIRANSTLELAYTAQAGEFYAFNIKDAAGYVIVSGDDRMPAVIGYSDGGRFSSDDMPENMRQWLNVYAEQVRYLQSHEASQVATSASYPAGNVYPLLADTKWNQSAPYNNMCPTYTYKGSVRRAATGCVATAMAQVMYYHRWPAVGSGSNSYTCSLNGDSLQSVTLSTDFSQSRYDWNSMLPAYAGGESETQNNAVAKLMSDCGVAMDMSYGASSGAVTRIAMNRMPTHFGYDKSMRFAMRDAYSLSGWLDIINGELASSRPVIHSGASAEGGHAFVIDGCDTRGYYHVNWGWGGSSNGYFILTDLTPAEQGIGSSEGGYNLRQGLVYGIMPDKGSAVGYSAFITEFAANSQAVALGADAQLLWNSFYVMWTGNGDASARLALGITDEAGNILRVPNYKQYSGFKSVYNYKLNLSLSVPTDMGEGTYYVVPLIAPVGSDSYQRVEVSRTSAQRIKMVVEGGYAHFSVPDNTSALSVKQIECSDVLAATRPINVKALIANGGAEFVDNLCVALLNTDGTVAATSVPKRVDVQSGAQVTLETTVTPSRAGSYKIAVVYASSQAVVNGANKSVTVGSTPKNISMAIASPLELPNLRLPGTHIQGRATVRNSGGAFAGRLEAFILAEGSSSIINRVYSDFVTVKSGETKVVKFDGSFTQGEVGQAYQIIMRDPNNTTGNYIWGDFVYFTIVSPVPHDVNMDGVFDVGDATSIISHILDGVDYPFNQSEADVNADGVIDVNDVSLLISLILE
mgnify:CR=1 FL=1